MQAHGLLLAASAGALALVGVTLGLAHAACCYFTAKGQEVLQPGQQVFITWDPQQKLETFTVQPQFEGGAADFGLLVPTPTRPKLHAMPRDFFKHLAVFTALKQRTFPSSKLLPLPGKAAPDAAGGRPGGQAGGAVRVLEAGLVGTLEYKIIAAGHAEELYQWLKQNRYHYAGNEVALGFYVRKQWTFTALRIDSKQQKPNKDGSYSGDVTPTRFEFTSEKLVYPLRITQVSVKDRTAALFYVQAPFKVDLPGDLSYQYQWVHLLQAASGHTPGGLPGHGAEWLRAVGGQVPEVLRRGKELGFEFTATGQPRPNKQGRTPTTLEWAKRLTAEDVKVLRGEATYSEKVPDVDEGFTPADLREPAKREAIFKVIRRRLAQARKDRPTGYLVREAPADDVRGLRQLVGPLQAGQFLTRFRHVFTRDEMTDDLTLVPARLGDREDTSEYEEALRP
jgi:hypothetical protein